MKVIHKNIFICANALNDNNLSNTLKRRKRVQDNWMHNVCRVEILPYHSLAIAKYDELKIPYALRDTPSPEAERIENAKKILECDKYTRWRE